MTPPARAALAAALDAALARALPAMVWVPGTCALVTDARDPDAAEVALERVRAALDGAGLGAGRRLVLIAAHDGRVASAALAGRYARAAGAPAIAHDPARSPCFSPGRGVDGAPLALNDELREAELVLVLAGDPAGRGDDPLGARAAIAPGLAAAGTLPCDAATLERLLPIDGALAWRAREDGTWWADAGPLDVLEARLANLDRPKDAG